MSEAKKKALQDPEKRDRVASAAREQLQRWHRETDRDWSAWHRNRAARQHRDIPADRWDDYQALRKQRGVGAAEAKRMILEEIARAERQRLAAMTPFERQQDALRRGATLINKPVMRKADHAFTLAGNSMGSIA